MYKYTPRSLENQKNKFLVVRTGFEPVTFVDTSLALPTASTIPPPDYFIKI